MGWPRWDVGSVLAARPAVRVDQLGVLPGEPVTAAVVEPEPGAPAELLGRTGRTIDSVAVDPPAFDPTSGQRVAPVVFAAPGERGPGFRVRVGAVVSRPFAIDAGLHAPLAVDALQVLTLLRSGVDASDGAPAGHLGDAALPAWSGPDAEALYPGWRCPGRFDVSGGWYDAGDYGRYTTSGGIALWQLLTALDLPWTPPGTAEECRWQLDWMLRMQVPEELPLAGCAFHRLHGTRWSPVPGAAHLDPTARVLHRPSAPATFHLAATAALGARRFRDDDPGYAAVLLAAARRAYAAGLAHADLLPPDDHARFGGGPYADDDPADDAYWAATELWLTTGERPFLEDLRRSPWYGREADQVPELDGFDFDRVAVPALLDLAAGGDAEAEARVVGLAEALLTVQARQPWRQPYAPASGWGWGSSGRLLNNLVVLSAAHRSTGDQRFRSAVAAGIGYLLGRNALGQSYVTGYGVDDSRHQRTRRFGRDLDPTLPPLPSGAVAGGPNSQPSPDFPYDDRLVGLPPQQCYIDEPTSEVTNDICIRWQAPLVHAAACLAVDR